ncbi:hypothetical protein FKW77_004968 [Venturia effusa]|uniref:Uncharacterized protein n=1 Tax=Venturia effusa TaxID=50376 RepID=A0A517L385_9PEZI|nr:hypothetical protein FKW77_004968 [Venturia effusa]
MASSLPLFAQAIVHFNHVATLAMLMSLTLLAGHIVAPMFVSRAERLERMCGTIAVTLALLLILFDEYRLTVNGILFGLSALGFAVVGRTLFITTLQTDSSHGDVPERLSWDAVVRVLVSFAFMPTLAWAMFVENTLSAIESFVRNPLHVVINLVLVCVCLDIGSKTMQRLHEESSICSNETPTLFMFTGLTSLVHLLAPRRSYSSCWQIAVFLCIFALSFVRGWDSPTASGMDEKVDAERFGDGGLSHEFLSAVPASDPEARSTDNPLEDPQGHMYFENILDRSVVWRSTTWTISRTPGATSMGVAFGLWCVFSYLNVSLDTRASFYSRHIPALDLSYQPRLDLDIVLNMYDEDPASAASMISDIRNLPSAANKTTRVLIYYKGKIQNQIALEALKHQAGATELIRLPNIGREGEGFLNHIVTRYNDLARHTLFLQARVHNYWELKRMIGHYFVPRTGMLNLGFSEVCHCDDCWDRHGWRDDISKVYQSVYNSSCASALLSYKGQFIVSSERIRGLDRSIYEGLRNALVHPTSWAHREPYLRGREDSMNAPQFGYTLERVWSILFQCSEMEIVDKCPTLLSGTRSGGDIADCQCLDDG